MRVTVDADRCAGHGVCMGLCPEVFHLTDEGYAVTKVTEVPPQYESAVRRAVEQCPTWAVSVE